VTETATTIEQDMPLVTVITATYNAAATLQVCLDSVRAQAYPAIEHLVIDAASTDQTRAILMANDVPRLRWISEPDRGIYDAWNKGLSMARGQWIAFLGADDVYLPGAIEAFMDLAAKTPEAEYLSAQAEYVLAKRPMRIIGRPWSWPRFQRYMCVSHVGSMHRRDLYQKYGTYDTGLRIVADYEFLLRAGKQLKTAYMARRTVRMGGGGVSDSVAALKESAQVKHRTGGRARVLVELECIYARCLLRLR
jgi:glycosyltransferase involved in cell wall biosynthesis